MYRKNKEFFIEALKGFKISDLDDTGAKPYYYGYQNIFGNWYIMEETASTFRFVYGDEDYASAWSGRALATYTLFATAFAEFKEE